MNEIQRSSVYTRPQVSMSVPNVQPKIAGQPSKALLRRLESLPLEEIDKIVLISTWNVRCGIATYTNYLLNELEKIAPDTFMVNPIDKGILNRNIKGKLTHIQHEFGIMPYPIKPPGKVIITWHTVPRNISATIKKFEQHSDVVAHIVHSSHARDYISSSKDIYVVSHGSTLIPAIKKEDARKIIGIDTDKPVGFVFGFQSGDKNYHRLTCAARNADTHLMISGARHESSDYRLPSSIIDDENVTFIDRYLAEIEVNLYALASDMLLFDYAGKDHHSVSGAMHRIIGAGRPVICSDVNHFGDIDIAQKFTDQDTLENAIINALKNQKSLGRRSLEYAKETSWKNVAREHIEIYKKYIDL